jgi:hypothetical protein
MAISAFKRYELKFMLKPGTVRGNAGRHRGIYKPDDYCGNGNCYTIFNIYYDTGGLFPDPASLSKPYYKEKMRMRSYERRPRPRTRFFSS